MAAADRSIPHLPRRPGVRTGCAVGASRDRWMDAADPASTPATGGVVGADPCRVADLRPGQASPAGDGHGLGQRGLDVGELAGQLVHGQFWDGLLDVADPFAAGGGCVRQLRLYGNWRAERGWGIGRLSSTATIIVFLAVLAPLLAVSTAPVTVLPLTVAGAGVVAAIVIRIGGRSAADVLGVRLRFWRARHRGWTRLSASVLADDTRAADLPGVMAPLRPLDIDDGRGRRHVLLHNRRTGTLTAVLRCAPIGLRSRRPRSGWPRGADCSPTSGINPSSGTSRSPSTPPPPAAAVSPPTSPPTSTRARRGSRGRSCRNSSPTPQPAPQRCRCGCRCASTQTGPPRNPRICSPPASRSAAGYPGSRPSSPAAVSPSTGVPPSPG